MVVDTIIAGLTLRHLVNIVHRCLTGLIFVIAPPWTNFMFDVAVITTVIAGLMFDIALCDSNNRKANNIDQQARTS